MKNYQKKVSGKIAKWFTIALRYNGKKLNHVAHILRSAEKKVLGFCNKIYQNSNHI